MNQTYMATASEPVQVIQNKALIIGINWLCANVGTGDVESIYTSVVSESCVCPADRRAGS